MTAPLDVPLPIHQVLSSVAPSSDVQYPLDYVGRDPVDESRQWVEPRQVAIVPDRLDSKDMEHGADFQGGWQPQPKCGTSFLDSVWSGRSLEDSQTLWPS